MPPINRDSAKQCVRGSLKRISQFNGDCESFTFNHWHDFHKRVFINLVAACVSAKGSRIVLNETMIENHPTVGSFIDYVTANAVYLGEPRPDLQESQGDLH